MRVRCDPLYREKDTLEMRQRRDGGHPKAFQKLENIHNKMSKVDDDGARCSKHTTSPSIIGDHSTQHHNRPSLTICAYTKAKCLR